MTRVLDEIQKNIGTFIRTTNDATSIAVPTTLPSHAQNGGSDAFPGKIHPSHAMYDEDS